MRRWRMLIEIEIPNDEVAEMADDELLDRLRTQAAEQAADAEMEDFWRPGGWDSA